MTTLSRRTVLQGVTAAAAAGTVTSLAGGSPASAHGRDERPRSGEVSIPGATAADRAWARRQLARMGTDEKIGQVFNAYVYGADADTVTDAEATQNLALYGVRTGAEVVRRFHLGGVIYFAWSNNVANPTQIASLSNGLQRAALADTGVPLTVSTDQEQGLVTRIGAPATLFPGAMALGATRSTRDAQLAGRITGEELRAMGVTLDFAPDADVNVNPANPIIGVRSSGSDPALVGRIVAAQVRGLQGGAPRTSVGACAKHFPGHGDTATDSHYGLPVITHSRAQWEATDRPPFVAAIAAGIDCIMTAHLLVPALDDSGDPATLSHPIVTGILREELGFTGVVVTDGLAMAGVRQKYGDGEVAVRALLAGDDMLLQPPDLPTAFDAVQAAVASGRLPMQRLEEAVLRNLQLKSVRGVVRRPLVDVAALGRVVGTRQHLAVAEGVADDSITLLRNEKHLLPLGPRRDHGRGRGHGQHRLDGTTIALCGWSSGTATHDVLRTELEALGATVSTTTTGASPTAAQLATATAAAKAADVVLVTTYNVVAGSAQATLVAALEATGTPVVAVAVRNPYDIAQFPTVDAYLATYSYTAVSMRAVVRTLVGANRPTGKLPVVVQANDGSVLYPFGAGLTY